MKKELTLLRQKMKMAGVDVCIVPTADYHDSEYVGEYFQCRRFLSGFTGSAGTLVVCADRADLWTDGRYFIQAAAQLKDTGISLRKSGEPGVPTMQEFLADHMQFGQTLAVDGRCITMERYRKLEEALSGKGIRIRTDLDLPGEIWEDRPPMSAAPVWELPEEYAGESRRDKLDRIRAFLKEKKADYLLLSSLMDIAWLLNVRGGDIDCTPVVLSYLLVGREEVRWYLADVLTRDQLSGLAADGVIRKKYSAVYEDLPVLLAGKTVCYDSSQINSVLGSRIPETACRLDMPSPTLHEKAVKNPVERENFRLAHIKDGVAVTKFIFWIKKNVSSETITEISAARHLESLREEQKNYVGPSFAPIIAYKDHAALPHYSATPESDVVVYPGGFLLADTGGHYMEGTTDITRTISTGALTEEQREMYTLVLKGHIDVARAKFPEGTEGSHLDRMGRKPLNDRGLDYNHGTGHGVGYLLSVHEGPNAFRKRKAGEEDCIIEEGMITSNEPGLYLEGRYGIRLENLVLCVKEGESLRHDSLTMVPFDRAAIRRDLLTPEQRAWLNDYHRKVYETISPYLNLQEKTWLKEETRSL